MTLHRSSLGERCVLRFSLQGMFCSGISLPKARSTDLCAGKSRLRPSLLASLGLDETTLKLPTTDIYSWVWTIAPHTQDIYFFTSASSAISTPALSLFAKLPILIPSQPRKRGILVTIIIESQTSWKVQKRRAPTLRTKWYKTSHVRGKFSLCFSSLFSPQSMNATENDKLYMQTVGWEFM